MIVFTGLGVLVWLVACYRAGWWLGLAWDVLLPIWAVGRLEHLVPGIVVAYSCKDPTP